MIIAIDFDGTIHDSHHPLPGKVMGPPMPGAVEAMWKLYKEGHEIIIFTAREEGRHHVVEQWMNDWGIPFDSVTNVKPQHAEIFLDNHAIRFETWEDALNDIDYYGSR